ncbi:MAG: hypothetical protein K0V04_45570 [Deltaproteobacteria bacterium]|nr:hypothetical protein [Deltaproteobacteria bacterium]
MSNPLLHFFIVTVAGWLRRHQDAQLADLREDKRVLEEQLGKRRLRLTDAPTRRVKDP